MAANKVKLDETLEDLVIQFSRQFKGDKYVFSSRDVELPDEIENNLPEYLNKLQEAGLVEKFEYYFPGAWEVTVTPALVTYFVDDENEEDNDAESNSVKAEDGTGAGVNSDVDMQAVNRIIRQIQKYNIVLEAEFGPNVTEIREIAASIDYMLTTGEAPELIVPALLALRDKVLQSGSGIITNGIYHMIEEVL